MDIIEPVKPVKLGDKSFTGFYFERIESAS